MYGEYCTIWYRTPAGALVQQSGTPCPELPPDCTPVHPDEYFRSLAETEQAEHEMLAAEQAAVAERDALINEAVDFYLAAQQPEPEQPVTGE